jgi:hypothetical protein
MTRLDSFSNSELLEIYSQQQSCVGSCGYEHEDRHYDNDEDSGAYISHADQHTDRYYYND